MKRTLLICSLAAALSACGGGGGDSGSTGTLSGVGGGAGTGSSNGVVAGSSNNTGAGNSTTSPNDVATVTNPGSTAQREVVNYPISAALSTFFGTASTYRLAGTDAQGTSFQLSYEFVPKATAAGTAKQATVVKSTASINGSSPIRNESTFTYTAAPFTLYGTSEAYTQFPTRQPAPATAAVGSSGPLASGSEEGIDPTSGQTMSMAYSQTITWSLERETASTAWLCINTTTHSAPIGTEKDCARINEAGAILGYKVSVVDADIKVNLQQF
jgi:hypothetical protein